MDVTDEMVERAARALFEDPSADGDWTWDDLLREDGPERAKLWRDHARAILVAALSQPTLSGEPDPYEYETTTGQRKAWPNPDEPPEGEGWELDPNRGRPGESWERFDYHEERYWRRRPRRLHQPAEPTITEE